MKVLSDEKHNQCKVERWEIFVCLDLLLGKTQKSAFKIILREDFVKITIFLISLLQKIIGSVTSLSHVSRWLVGLSDRKLNLHAPIGALFFAYYPYQAGCS